MKLSIVISVLNEEALLGECLTRIKKQLRSGDEIIVVDNGSTDSSVDIAKRHKARVVHEPKRGIWAARATGYDSAKGDIIVCCDADTMVDDGWLKRIDQHFTQDESLLGLSGPGYFYDTNKVAALFGKYWYVKSYFTSVGLGLGHNTMFGSNFAIRKRTWNVVRDDVCKHTEKVFDDIDTAIHVGALGKIAYDPELRVGISFRPMRSPIGMLRRYKKAFFTIVSHWPQFGPWRMVLKRF